MIEIVPPYVQTGLTGDHQASDPNAMPLADYLVETMDLLKTFPEATEILVERVKRQRFAERSGDYDAFFQQFNETQTALRSKPTN